ncbi:hypothetical protein GCM10027610_045610 [Dactylosporangium cerinum]
MRERQNVERDLAGRADEATRLRRRLEQSQATAERLHEDNTRLQGDVRRLEGELERARDRAEDLRTQLARAVEREVTAQAQLQQQLTTLSGALAQLTGSRQPGVLPAETPGGETRHGAA